MNQKALSLQALAERLAISDETARREIEAGKLKAYRVARQWRVFEGDLQDDCAALAILDQQEGHTRGPRSYIRARERGKTPWA